MKHRPLNKNFNPSERELVRLANYFKKQSRKLIDAGKLSEELSTVEGAVDRFVAHLENHASLRAAVLEQREQLKKLVRDDAVCPQCGKSEMLKVVGMETNEKGWKSNRYRCRRCNIEFTWNKPNNPWDMVAYIEEVLTTLQLKQRDEAATDDEKDQLGAIINSMRSNLARLKPVIEGHREAYLALQSREEEMEKLVHEFRSSLLIEKVKLEDWEYKNRHPS